MEPNKEGSDGVINVTFSGKPAKAVEVRIVEAGEKAELSSGGINVQAIFDIDQEVPMVYLDKEITDNLVKAGQFVVEMNDGTKVKCLVEPKGSRYVIMAGDKDIELSVGFNEIYLPAQAWSKFC